MAKLTVAFGVLLIALGLVAYFLLGQHSHGIHSLIPAVFGLLLVIFGALANTPVAKKRMLFMHIAVTVGLLVFLVTIPGIIGVVQMPLGIALCGLRRRRCRQSWIDLPGVCAAVCAVIYCGAEDQTGVSSFGSPDLGTSVSRDACAPA